VFGTFEKQGGSGKEGGRGIWKKRSQTQGRQGKNSQVRRWRTGAVLLLLSNSENSEEAVVAGQEDREERYVGRQRKRGGRKREFIGEKKGCGVKRIAFEFWDGGTKNYNTPPGHGKKKTREPTFSSMFREARRNKWISGNIILQPF